MEDIKRKIEGNEELNKNEFWELLNTIGLTRSSKSNQETVAELTKMYKNVPTAASNYIEFNVTSALVHEYKFFSLDEILHEISELIINNTWNNHFMPLGMLTSI